MKHRVTSPVRIDLPAQAWLGVFAALSVTDMSFVPNGIGRGIFEQGIPVGSDMYTFHRSEVMVGDTRIDCVRVQKVVGHFSDSPQLPIIVDIPFSELKRVIAEGIRVVEPVEVGA